jgi:hypothetical protein
MGISKAMAEKWRAEKWTESAVARIENEGFLWMAVPKGESEYKG